MSSDNLVEFFESLGFEETEIEDNLIVLGIELTSEGHYALLTDAEGTMPKNPNLEITFAYYTPDDSFEWSACFKNSTVFKELWAQYPTAEAKLAAIVKYREANIKF